jgi:hypothetical protein
MDSDFTIAMIFLLMRAYGKVLFFFAAHGPPIGSSEIVVTGDMKQAVDHIQIHLVSRGCFICTGLRYGGVSRNEYIGNDLIRVIAQRKCQDIGRGIAMMKTVVEFANAAIGNQAYADLKRMRRAFFRTHGVNDLFYQRPVNGHLFLKIPDMNSDHFFWSG